MILIRAAEAVDATQIAAIYAPFVESSAVSFEENAPSDQEFARRIETGSERYPWMVAEERPNNGADRDRPGNVLAFAYATAFRERHAYRFAVETSIYVLPDAQRRGIGTMLYGALLDTLEAQGFTQALGTISLPNDASIRLHEMMGFFRAGTWRGIGWKRDHWRDVGLWQRPLADPPEPPPEPRSFREVGVVRDL
jgi:phosphinothricin acetyltransferase